MLYIVLRVRIRIVDCDFSGLRILIRIFINIVIRLRIQQSDPQHFWKTSFFLKYISYRQFSKIVSL